MGEQRRETTVEIIRNNKNDKRISVYTVLKWVVMRVSCDRVYLLLTKKWEKRIKTMLHVWVGERSSKKLFVAESKMD
jgi:hypothetical protein